MENSIRTNLYNLEIIEKIPFFLHSELFSKFLMALAKSDGKMHSLFNRLKIGRTTGLSIVEELIDKDIIRLTHSREEPIKIFKKQLIKKEFKEYSIEPKLYFNIPFLRFWYLCVEPTRANDLKIDVDKAVKLYYDVGYKLSSLLFEQLSAELLRSYYLNKDKIVDCASYWDRHTEFDIYCRSKSNKFVLGECKYKSRPITKAELAKLRKKAKQSGLHIDKYALFSKSGFSYEFYKNLESDTILFTLEEFKNIL